MGYDMYGNWVPDSQLGGSTLGNAGAYSFGVQPLQFPVSPEPLGFQQYTPAGSSAPFVAQTTRGLPPGSLAAQLRFEMQQQQTAPAMPASSVTSPGFNGLNTKPAPVYAGGSTGDVTKNPGALARLRTATRGSPAAPSTPGDSVPQAPGQALQWANFGIDAAGTAFNIGAGAYQLYKAADAYNFQRNLALTNLQNQAKSYNTAQEDLIRGRYSRQGYEAAKESGEVDRELANRRVSAAIPE